MWIKIAAQLVQMSDVQQRAYLARLNPGQLRALQAAALKLKQRTQLEGLGALGLKIGNLLKNIGGALIPFTAAIPGIGPIVAAVGTAAFSSLTEGSGGGGQSFAPPPPPPAPVSKGFTISPAMLMAGVALIVVLKR